MMSNLFDLSGRNAMIFGGAGGLGKLIAKAYAEAGANVAIASRGEEKLKAACEELKAETGKEFRYYVCDATDETAVEETARRANAEMGPVTILVNSQGINKKLPVLEFPVAEFNNVMNANVTSVLITAKHFGKYMKEAGYGKIVNVTSVRGKIATKGPGNAAYCASKGAVVAFTRALALDTAPRLRVNCVCPGDIATPLLQRQLEAAGGSYTLADVAEAYPMGRVGRAEEVAHVICSLLSPANSFMTGSIVTVDGGLTAK